MPRLLQGVTVQACSRAANRVLIVELACYFRTCELTSLRGTGRERELKEGENRARGESWEGGKSEASTT